MVLGLHMFGSKKESSYEVVRSLGHGSFGEVYQARVVKPVPTHDDRQNSVLPVGKQVAVKQIKVGVAGHCTCSIHLT